MNELGNGIQILPSLLGTSYANTHYMLLSIGVACISKNGSLRLLNNKMAKLIGKFKLMETCEVTKHSTVGHKLRKMFLHIGTNSMISISNPVAVSI